MDRHLAGPIRVSKEIYAKLDEIQRKTRLSKSEIASTLIEYALEHAKLVPADCFDITFE